MKRFVILAVIAVVACAPAVPPPAVAPRAEDRWLIDPRSGFSQAVSPSMARKFDAAWSAFVAGDLAGARPFGTIGYREATAVVGGTMTLDAAIAETKRRTRAYAKRQLTWLRSERNVHWLEAGNSGTLASALELI